VALSFPRLLLGLALAAVLAGSAAATTIEGGSGGSFLAGTPLPDRILGRAGPDRIMAAFGGRDRVSCGGGRDLVVADRDDTVANDCELVVHRLSTDVLRSPSAQHETGVEPDSASWGSTVVAVFQLARFERGAAAGIGFATSVDAGRTWRTGILPALTRSSAPAGPWPRASDPSIAYDAAHGFWLAATLTVVGGEDTEGGGSGSSGIAVSRSKDAVHWQAPVQVAVGPLLDKDWIACDNGTASPFRGRCYVVYADDDLHRLVSQTSTDGGATWSPPVRVTTDLIGAQPLVRPDGTLVVVAGDLDRSTDGALFAFRSADGGATFGGGVPIASATWTRPGAMRAIPLPSGAVDANGTLDVAWHDCRFQPGCAGNDIVLSTSADGTSWSAPVPVTHGGTDHFLTGLDADPSRPGRLALVYELFQPGSCAHGDCRLGAAFTTSSDGGATWSAPLRLDAQPFSQDWIAAAGGRMVGDYFSTSFVGDRVVPVFTLAAPPLRGRFREAIFAASLPLRQ
jgi:hypothetical protein